MTARQKLFRVELPLAAPVIMAGIRTAAVWTIGMATLVDHGRPDQPRQLHLLRTADRELDFRAGRLRRRGRPGARRRPGARPRSRPAAVRPRRRPHGDRGWPCSLIGTAAAASLAASRRRAQPMSVGAKNFSEQFILADADGATAWREPAHDVVRKEGLGSAIIFRALAGGDIDAYVDYSGTLWTNVLGAPRLRRRATAMLAELTSELRDALRRHRARRARLRERLCAGDAARPRRAAGIATIADLAPLAPRLTLGSDLEFLSRPEWSALKTAYGLAFAQEKSFNPTFMYRAVVDGSVDVISAFSSDGRIAADDLVVLADVKHAIPAYDAVILISPRRRDDAVLRRGAGAARRRDQGRAHARGQLHGRSRCRQGLGGSGGAVFSPARSVFSGK